MKSFPLKSSMDDYSSIAMFPRKEWRRVFLLAQYVPASDALGLLFTPSASPVDVDVVRQWEKMAPTTIPSDEKKGQQVIMTALKQLEQKIHTLMKRPEPTRSNLIFLLKMQDRQSFEAPYWIAKHERIPKAIKYVESKLDVNQRDVFPIDTTLTANDIKGIPSNAWNNLVQKTKHAKNALDLMFQDNTKPITMTECVLYRVELEKRITNQDQTKSLSSALDDRFRIAFDFLQNRDITCTAQHITHLLKMKIHLEALEYDHEPALGEMQKIVIALEKCGISFLFAEPKKQTSLFPLQHLLTINQIKSISRNSILVMIKHSHEINSTYGSIDAMFVKKTYPITILECEIYKQMIHDAKIDTIDSDIVIELLNNHQRGISKFLLKPNLKGLLEMKTRLEELRSPSETQPYIRQIEDKMRDYLETKNNLNDSDSNEGDSDGEDSDVQVIVPQPNPRRTQTAVDTKESDDQHFMWQKMSPLLTQTAVDPQEPDDEHFMLQKLYAQPNPRFNRNAVDPQQSDEEVQVIDPQPNSRSDPNAVDPQQSDEDVQEIHGFAPRVEELETNDEQLPNILTLYSENKINDDSGSSSSDESSSDESSSDDSDSEVQEIYPPPNPRHNRTAANTQDPDIQEIRPNDSEHNFDLIVEELDGEQEDQTQHALIPFINHEDLSQKERDKTHIHAQGPSEKKSNAKKTLSANQRPIKKTTANVVKIDTTKPIFPFAQLKKFFDAHIRALGGPKGARKFPISAGFLESLNLRIYEWVRDVMSFLVFTQMPGNEADTEQRCQSGDISAKAIAEAIELNNPNMDLLNEYVESILVDGETISLPKPRKTVLGHAILFYANPLRRVSAQAYQIMVHAIKQRLIYLSKAVWDLTTRTNGNKLAVCPSLSTVGRVPINQVSSTHLRNHG